MTTVISFIEQFHLLMDKRKSTADFVYLRSGITSEEESVQFIKTFSEMTETDWVIHDGRPHSQKFIFLKTWLCHRSWHRKTEFSAPDANCNAKIDILLKKISPSTVKNQAYLNPNLPLHCVIRLSMKHSHDLENDDGLQMAGLTKQWKEVFFKYFRSGLNATEARRKHEILIKSKTNTNLMKPSFNPTTRQVKHLYNYWMNQKNRMDTLKVETDSIEKVTFTELLKAIPKIELQQVSKQIPLAVNIDPFSAESNLQPPLVFVSTSSTETTTAKAPLLYQLKYGINEAFVSHLTVPKIFLIRIESTVQYSCDSNISKPANKSEVSVKLEPPDIDEETASSICVTSGNVQGSSMLPVIIKAFSCDSDSLCADVSSRNLDLANDIIDANKFTFPLVFTFTGMTGTPFDENAPLLYSLKQGPYELYVTPVTIPQIFSVQISSTSQATLIVQNASSNTEVPLDVNIQVEHIKCEMGDENSFQLKSHISMDTLKMPDILNVSSSKKKKIDKPSNACKKLLGHTIPTFTSCIPLETCLTKKTVAASSKQLELKNDEDYQFLMSLLPELKQLPLDQKKQVKKKMQEFVITSRLCASKIRFEKTRSNIYRDCGVLPSLRDWKF